MKESGSHRFIVLRAGDVACALPLSAAVETMRPLPVDPIPEMPDFLLGVSVIRGDPVPVVDLRRLIGAPSSAPPSRVATFRVDGRVCALAADDVAGVREFDEDVLGRLPPLLRDAGEGMVASLGTLDRQLLLVLKAGKIVPLDAWALVARPEGETR